LRGGAPRFAIRFRYKFSWFALLGVICERAVAISRRGQIRDFSNCGWIALDALSSYECAAAASRNFRGLSDRDSIPFIEELPFESRMASPRFSYAGTLRLNGLV